MSEFTGLEYMADLPTEHVDGSLISGKVSRVVEAIREYDPNLDVAWIPPAARAPGDAAFQIIHKRPDGTSYVAFMVQTEEEFDSRVLKRIMANDQAQRGGTTWSELQLDEMAKADLAKRRRKDAWDEAQDMAMHMMKSPLHNYKLPNGRVIRS